MLNRKGFTLIELLIVVVIIGILAAIAIPKFASTKEKAYLASMKSDLRNLATSQEGYFADFQLYRTGGATNVGGVATPDLAMGNYTPSAGVTVAYLATGGTGWTATATHTALAAGRLCAIAYGVPPIAPATVEGEPKCN
jgi:prepilin-type N-terminal cleavage/methylation domain-containing protein